MFVCRLYSLSLHSLTYLDHFKDLCGARCIHASESRNCTSHGIETDITCQCLPEVSTQSMVFISGSEIQGMHGDLNTSRGRGR